MEAAVPIRMERTLVKLGVGITLATALIGAVGCGGEPPVDANVDNVEETAAATTSWDLVVVRASFDETYKGASWDNDGTTADPVVDLSSGAEPYDYLGSTTIQNDTTSPEWSETLLYGMESRALTADGFGLSLLDVDPSSADKVNFNIQDGDFPDDDYIGSVGTLVWGAMFEESEHVIDMSYDGVSASVTIALVPSSAAPSCGDVPVEGRCAGNVVQRCVASKQAVYEFDCGAAGGACDLGSCVYEDAGAP
jgi:hypothetical protein